MKTIQRLLSLVFGLMLALSTQAQNLSVARFYLAENDMSALDNPVIDQNGNKCALIRVQTTQKGFVFDVGSLGVKKVDDNKVGEVWVYVPAGVKHIDIRHQQLGSLNEYAFPISIQSARTYKMELIAGNVISVIEQAVTQQYVVFEVEPKNASIEFDNQMLEVVDGSATKRMSFGTYSYRVNAPRHFPETGSITVNDPDHKHIVPIKLRPAYSSFTFACDDRESEIWINNKRLGTGSVSAEFGYEAVLVECRRAGHRTSRKELMLDASLAQAPIKLDAPIPIYGSLDLNSAPANADIYVDGNKVGTTPMFLAKQIIGNHQIRLTRTGYADYTVSIAVEEGKTAEVNARLQNAMPVRLTCNEPSAKVSVDGTFVGVPADVTSLAIGSHTIRLQYEDNAPTEQVIEVRNSATTQTFDFSVETGAFRTFTVKGVSFKMIKVEKGTFQMGSTTGDSDEKPVHSVTISKDYYIGETEVTQALWKAVMGYSSTFDGSAWSSSYGLGDNYPVYYISYENVQSFIKKLNQQTGQRFRMPTEAEWEYASKGGNKSKGYTNSGSNTIGDVAWYRDNSGSKTHPVKTKSPNELGIYDMSGNVYEWCSDWYGPYSYGAVTDPTGPSSGSYRVYRGGSWYNYASGCRSAFRHRDTPSFRYSILGFRLAL